MENFKPIHKWNSIMSLAVHNTCFSDYQVLATDLVDASLRISECSSERLHLFKHKYHIIIKPKIFIVPQYHQIPGQYPNVCLISVMEGFGFCGVIFPFISVRIYMKSTR